MSDRQITPRLRVSPGGSRALVNRITSYTGHVMKKPRIVIFALGGTILMTGDSQSGVKPNLSADDLISSLPELAEIADIEVNQIVQKASGALTFSDIALLATATSEENRRGVDGVVVIQGTDTIEETAFALDLMLDINCPVVVTGAMRNPSMPGSDGPANLVSALSAAANAACSDYGVLVAFDSELHLASHVAKCDSIQGDAFNSPLCGPIGRIVEGRVLLFTRPVNQKSLHCDPDSMAPISPVALLITSINDDGGLISAAVNQGYKAIVLAGMGAGHVRPELVECLEDAANQIPVILCSRNSGGQVCKQTYGYPGGEIDLLQRGLISAGWLPPLKTKVLTTLMLSQGAGKEDIATTLATFDGGVS